MRRGLWPVVGLVVGGVVGFAWGWFGAGGYEALDSAAGTSFLCALGGLLIGGIVYGVSRR
ncbi:hypothetical protein OWR29_34730 [Actinoplanes sp. Pm04-4]|uniref:GlsB/YeaQ/YmgE family stress response membrane protein n=1 Tax=Paractinoplanes pyxinae TaxID=2997416 RepID=A0ABT4B9J9_9ACTN|nr:hypothetical protein [Actinoplanes pyxinae]MCY1143181.1 hypothetical protein [Actinoplanes pyxinae]